MRQLDELVGRVAHRRDDGDDLAARAPGRDQALRDTLQLVGVTDGGAAELHHDEARRAGCVLDRRNCFELGHRHLRQCRQPMRPGHWTLRQYVMVVFGAIGVGLLPWTLWLSSSLKPHHATEHWDIAWAGFDAGSRAAFVLTAIAAWRRSPWVSAAAAATGTLLVADAWFDIVLESRGELIWAVLFAVFGELPLAAVCFWIAYRTERFLAQIVQAAADRGDGSHLAAAGEGAAEGDLIGVLEVAPDGQSAREPGDADAPA